MERAPEQHIVDYLEAAGYGPDSIIRYLEASRQKRWAEHNFAEGPEALDYTVCERPDGTRYGTDGKCDPATGKEVTGEERKDEPGKQQQSKTAAKPLDKPDKSVDELRQEKMKKTAAVQGSDPINNRKVMIDGQGYGWAMEGGKWKMVPWGSVAGIKTVGPKQAAAKRSGRRGGSSSESGRIKGLRIALEKQTNEPAREAIRRQIRELGGSV